MDRMNALSRGVAIFIALAVLTGIEYIFAQLQITFVALILVALLKAGLVLWYFMHLPKVFAPPSEGEHE